MIHPISSSRTVRTWPSSRSTRTPVTSISSATSRSTIAAHRSTRRSSRDRSHGGVVQGIGQALWEEAVYDETGQLVTGSMLDYALPRADCLPPLEVLSTVTPSPHHPLGVKGIGEAGTIASTVTVYNAVMDALRPLGVTSIDMPLTPERVWRAVQDAQGTGH